jgi:hypothetical protein
MGLAVATKAQEKKSKAPESVPELLENRYAAEAVGMPAGMPLFLQRTAAGGCSCGSGAEEECEECRQKRLSVQRKSKGDLQTARIPEPVHRVLESGGAPLDRSSARFMEARFGRDFGHVRIHDGPEASQAAASVNAHAFTTGSNIVFGTGQFSPHSQPGRRLLAHELTHVLQQSGGGAPSTATDAVQTQPIQSKAGISVPGEPSEIEADRVADRIMSSPAVPAPVSTMLDIGGRISRQPNDPDAGPPPADAGSAGGPPDQPGGERYNKQAQCVIRLGGCPQTRDAGLPSDSDIAQYNRECAGGTGYAGRDITPSGDECNQYASGQLVDPAKLQRLQALASQYQARLSAGELTVGDAQRIDAALRRAYDALQRGGVQLPGLPAAPEIPPDVSLDGPAVLLAGLPAVPLVPAAPAAPAVAGPTLTLIQGGGGAADVAAGGTAAGGAGAAIGTAFIVVAVVAVVAVSIAIIYVLLTSKEAEVDPTIPRDLDESNKEIEETLAAAKRPIVVPVMPAGLSVADQELWKECLALHESYKELQDDLGTLGPRIAQILDNLDNSRPTSDQERIDLCDALDDQIKLAERLHKERSKYMDKGCDKFDWFNTGNTEPERRKAHGDELDNVDKQIKNLRAAKTKYCPPFKGKRPVHP